MGFSLPVFNLPVNIWRFGNPPTNPPDLQTIGNLCLGRRIGINNVGLSTAITSKGGMWVLLPAGTDIRDGCGGAGPDTVEIAAGSTRYYTVAWVDDAGGGFPNEHRFAALEKQCPWLTPYPTPGGGGALPPAVGTVGFGGSLNPFNATPAASFRAGRYFLVMIVDVPPGDVISINDVNNPTLPFTQIPLTPFVGATEQYLVICPVMWPFGINNFQVSDTLVGDGLAIVVETFSFTSDVSTSNVVGGSPLTVVAGAAYTGLADSLIAIFGAVNSTDQLIAVPPFVDISSGRVTFFSSFGNQLDLMVAAVRAVGASPNTAQATCTPGTPFVAIADLEAYK